MFSVLNLQEFVTRVKRLEIPNVKDGFSCLENIINIDGLNYDGIAIILLQHILSFLM